MESERSEVSTLPAEDTTYEVEHLRALDAIDKDGMAMCGMHWGKDGSENTSNRRRR